jgi:hypothetical protein
VSDQTYTTTGNGMPLPDARARLIVAPSLWS